MRIPLFISALLVLSFTFAQDNNYQVLNLDPILTENANAVVRLDEIKIDILSHKSLRYKVRQAFTVLNKMGDQFARTQLHYDKERKIKNIEIYVYDGFGSEIKHIKRKDFRDYSAADGFSLYTDNRLIHYKYTPVQYPYTLEINYEIETSDTGFFPPWYFLSDYQVSVEKSLYEIKYAHASLRPEIKEYNLEGLDFSKKEKPLSITYIAENIKAIKKENLSPSFSQIVPRLLARLQNFHLKGIDATVTNWNDMGAWIDSKLLKGRGTLPEPTKSKVKELVKGVDDTLERAKIIYQYVQDNTRYISVQIGIGGWQPISAVEVDRVKYGDCKGLSNYTKALLKIVGVESYYVVVHAGNSKIDFDEDFSILQGNHAILAIPYKDKYFWIDCTSQVHPFGFVGDFTDDRKVLVVKPGGGEIVKTVAYLNKQNRQNTSASYSMSPAGDLTAKINIKTTGVQYDNRFYLETEFEDDVEKHYKKYWSNINNLNIASYEFKNNRDTIVFEENVAIEAKNYATRSGSRLLFVLNALNRNTFVPKRYRSRKLPFKIQRGFYDEDNYTIKLPEGYAIEAIPESKKIDSEFGTYTLSVFKQEDGSLKYQRTFFLKSGEYPKEKYAAYRTFRKTVAKHENSQVVLLKS
jgi:uncharacterized protein DUF3857/transglutaminase superfamily protein